MAPESRVVTGGLAREPAPFSDRTPPCARRNGAVKLRETPLAWERGLANYFFVQVV